MTTHTQKKAFKCHMEGCTSAFKVKYSPRHHLRTVHAAVKPHQCKLCNKGFTEKRSLQDHLHTHAPNSTPYYCSICDRGFPYYASFNKHVRAHAGKIPPKPGRRRRRKKKNAVAQVGAQGLAGLTTTHVGAAGSAVPSGV